MRTPPLYIRAKVGGGRGAYSARKIGPGIVVPPPFFVFIFPGKRCWFRVRRAHSGVYPDTAGGGEGAEAQFVIFSPFFLTPHPPPPRAVALTAIKLAEGGGRHSRKEKQEENVWEIALFLGAITHRFFGGGGVLELSLRMNRSGKDFFPLI